MDFPALTRPVKLFSCESTFVTLYGFFYDFGVSHEGTTCDEWKSRSACQPRGFGVPALGIARHGRSVFKIIVHEFKQNRIRQIFVESDTEIHFVYSYIGCDVIIM